MRTVPHGDDFTSLGTADVAAVAVVLAHLLPAALGEVGLWALGVFIVALVLPAGFERLIKFSERRTATLAKQDASWVAVEFGYFGLLVHRLGDGIALGLFTGTGASMEANMGALVAVVAHTVPVTAVLVLAYTERYGARHALMRAMGMAAAAVVGDGGLTAVTLTVIGADCARTLP